MSLRSIAVVQGPNLNMLGLREPTVYGSTTLEALHAELGQQASEWGVSLSFFQSNHEGDLIDFIQACRGRMDGIVINPGGLTHSSVSLRDALVASEVPFVEVHVSNIHAREPFRHVSLLSDVSQGVIVGFGLIGYTLALRGLLSKLEV